jgi:hypothetical protein
VTGIKLVLFLGLRRSGVFLELEALKPSLPPTLQQTDAENIDGYKQLNVNTSLPINSNNNTTISNKPVEKDIQYSKSKAVNVSHLNSQPNLNKVNLVRPESFTKPTSIPPIGKLLVTSVPTSQIRPMASQLLKIKEPEALGPINKQFVAVDDISRIEDMPKMPEIDSMESFFKNDFDKDFKRNVIKRMSFKRNYQGSMTSTKPTLTIEKPRKGKKKRSKYRAHFRILRPSSVTIKRHFWSQKTAKRKNEIFMIAPQESHFTSMQIKNKVEKIILGKRQHTGKKVFIPPPAPVQLETLEPFKKEKDIEDISKETIKIEQPEPLEGIDKHLQKIDSQPEIKPISDHLIKNEPIKAVDNMDPIKPIDSMATS